jgi:DNA invertase Pin-like site-specific DNA recombinase
MNKIESSHLRRRALIYIRQSSMTQVRNNLESQKLQYDLEKRARALGWKEPAIVDEDLGKSASVPGRSGFQFLLEEVCAGGVGAIFAIEASRLSRCGSEWHSLLEFCAIVGTLIIDAQSIYDPRLMDDRFLLGLKGTMSEMEVTMLRARTRGASLEKARRGELYVHATTGFVILPGDRRAKDPNKRTQRAIETVFETFEKEQTIGKTALRLRDMGLEIPLARGKNGGEPRWRLPQYSTIRGILTNPAYAGAYVYGRTRRQVEIQNGTKIVKVKAVAPGDALVLIRDHHEGYISWEQYETIQQTLQNNRNTGKDSAHRGAPREGAALLAGMLRCGGCGCKLVVRYYGDGGCRAAYFCNRNSKVAGEKRCLYCASGQVDEQVEQKLLEVISPLGVAAALEAHRRAGEGVARVEEQCRLRLEQNRYEAQRAQRQYDLSDPENRLVTSELEKRWDHALEQVVEGEAELEKILTENQPLDEGQLRKLEQLGEDFSKAWSNPGAPIEIKKRIVRTVIEEIVVSRGAETLILVIHWKGGDHTELSMARRHPGNKTNVRVLEIIGELWGTISNEELTGVLNGEKLTTGTGLSWTAKRVQQLARKKLGGTREGRAKLTIEQAASQLDISVQQLEELTERGTLRAQSVCASAPLIIDENDLEAPTTKRAIAALKEYQAQQQDLDLEL